MTENFDEAWAAEAISQLEASGVVVAPGLGDSEIDEIEVVFGAPVPPELAAFLKAGVPTSPKWADWLSGPSEVFQRTREWIDGAFAFDIQKSGYWRSRFGDRPADDDAAVVAALEVVHAAPPLLPIIGHRYIATAPTDRPRAVLSVWQAVDSIVYGNDLADYFSRDLRLERPPWAATTKPPVPVWDDLFDL